MVKYIRNMVFTILSVSLTGCGYDVVLQYERTPSVFYRMVIKDSCQEAIDILTQAFKDENLEPVFLSNFGGVRSYSISHSSSRISFKLYCDIRFKDVDISIYPARLVSYSKTRENEYEKRKQSLLRIKEKLEKADIFDGYIPKEWEGIGGQPVGVPHKPEGNF